MQGLVRSGIPTLPIQWETNTKSNAGVDIAFWNERASISVDVYNSKIRNMLVYENVGGATGFGQVATNNGKMKNTGFDASANLRIVNGKNWKWGYWRKYW